MAWAPDEFEKGLDGSGRPEQTGASGDRWDPLGPGATARYEDGLKATVSPPRREPDGTYGLTVTYENDTGEEVSFGGACETPEVRAGEPLDDVADHDLTWLNRRERDSALARPLGVDETRGVPVHAEPSRRGGGRSPWRPIGPTARLVTRRTSCSAWTDRAGRYSAFA